MSQTECTESIELFEVGRQQVTMSFDGGNVVSDAGLLPIRELDQDLGILAEAASRLPDPRSGLYVTHSAENILTQQVYQILAGYPDGNDDQLLRHDPLFKTIVGRDPRNEDQPLASGSTINRFLHGFTRRECEKPIEDRDVIFEVRRAQVERINALNDFLFKVGALLQATHRRIWLKLASYWPGADLLTRASNAVKAYVAELHKVWRGLNLLPADGGRSRGSRARISFAPVLLK